MADGAQPLPAGAARSMLFKRLVDVVAMPASSIEPSERVMAADLLLEMLFEADNGLRRQCAERLRHSLQAPRHLLNYLAQCHADVARIILEDNKGLNASDLIKIVRTSTPEHRRLIAGRRPLELAVADVLAEHAEPHVLMDLLANPTVELSIAAMESLVERSREHTKLVVPIAARPELIPGQALVMFWWADGATREKLLMRHATPRSELIDRCTDVFPVAAAEGWRDPVVRKALQLVERRQRNRAAIEKSPYESLDDAVSAAAVEGMSPAIAQEIGYLAGVKPVTIAQILSDRGGEGLAVLCKATGLKRAALRELWSGLGRAFETGDGAPDPGWEQVLKVFELLSVAKAQSVLRYWNWSLSSRFSPTAGVMSEAADNDSDFSISTKTAKLVFGSRG